MLKAIPSSPLLSANGVVGSAGGRPVTSGTESDPSGFRWTVSLPTVSSFRGAFADAADQLAVDLTVRSYDFRVSFAVRAGESLRLLSRRRGALRRLEQRVAIGVHGDDPRLAPIVVNVRLLGRRLGACRAGVRRGCRWASENGRCLAGHGR